MGAINFYMQDRFFTLAYMAFIPMGVIIYMQECSVHSLLCLLFPWVQCSLKPVLSQCRKTGFVTVDDFIPCTLAHVFYSQGCNKFLHARMFFTLIRLLYPSVWCIYMQECSVHSVLCLLFPWVQCQSLKPVLSQCRQTGFVTVDLLPSTLAHSSSIPMGAINFYIQEHFLHSCWCNRTNFYRDNWSLAPC